MPGPHEQLLCRSPPPPRQRLLPRGNAQYGETARPHEPGVTLGLRLVPSPPAASLRRRGIRRRPRDLQVAASVSLQSDKVEGLESEASFMYSTLTEYLLQSAKEQNCSNQQQHSTITWISGRGASAARAEEQQQLVLQCIEMPRCRVQG
ncbi:hypothetical protein ZWY2020_015127 [Hordeum vulgare]|nr:hypothetical protein ZWY2020_015127 [Hordeum vulgare]